MSYKKRFAIIILFVNLLFLGGCAYLQKAPSFKYTPWEDYQVKLQQIAGWTMSGALSITRNKKRDVVRFKWEQKQNSYTINISGPLNINNVRIVGDSNGVEFWRTRKECIRANTPEQLLLSQLGWQLPIANIRYWILALQAPNIKIDAVNFDQYGHLIYLNQGGWQIKYLEFQRNTEKNLDLPKVIELANQEITVKIKIIDQVF